MKASVYPNLFDFLIRLMLISLAVNTIHVFIDEHDECDQTTESDDETDWLSAWPRVRVNQEMYEVGREI